jgi:predicted HTH transcriptional regulator
MLKQPFDDEFLDEIFKFDPEHDDRLASRESSKLDFKESFNLGSADEYSRTMAAFANTAGGYLVFGVKDKPRNLIGLKSDNFDSVDPAKVTQALNERFAPEIHWEPYIHSVKGKKVGIIYIYEASRKPVVCLRSSKEIQEGAIYYRYRGRTEKIRYPELRELLDAELKRERALWMNHFQRMATIGIENVGMLNTLTGEISGSQRTFLIPEVGNFHESDH